MRRKRQSRTTVQPPTNLSYWKRQIPDLTEDREQYAHFGRFSSSESDVLTRLLSRPVIAEAIASGKLVIVQIDELSLDDEVDEEV